jgi:proton-translocating NADH-quinone oxidoreductase chain M
MMPASTLFAIVDAASPSPAPVIVPGAGIFSSPVLLSILVWTPVLMATVIAVLPNPRGRFDVLMKQIAFFTNLGLLFVLFIAYSQFQTFLPTMQYEEKQPWLPAIGVTYDLGVDGPGITMLILSSLVGLISVLASLGIRERVRSYFCLLLLSETCVTGTIVAHDMFVLVLFWGAAAIPLALLVLGWGGPRREQAAWRLLGHWGFGTAALVVAVMVLYSATASNSFDMDVVLKSTLAPRVQLVIGLAVIVAAATRLPLFPLTGWVRDVYAGAPVGVAVVLAGSATRLGGYLLFRALVGAEPVASQLLSPFMAALAALTVAYAAVCAMRAADLRQSAAFLSLIPGGVTMLGLAALSPLSLTGSVLSFFSGGMAAALIVGVCATISERANSRSLLVLRGLAPRMPKLAWILVLAAFGLIGVPLMASFAAEVMTFFGAFRNQPVGTFAVAAGLALAGAALAILLGRVLFGSPDPDAPAASDASLGETWYLAMLAGSLLWVGLVPAGPKLPGTDTPLFDPGLVNVLSAGLSDIASPYTGPTQ